MISVRTKATRKLVLDLLLTFAPAHVAGVVAAQSTKDDDMEDHMD